MAAQNRTSNKEIDEFSKDLDLLASQVQILLDELRKSQTNFVETKVQIVFLIDNVKNLSNIIKDGNGHSLMTRMAVVEENIKIIKEYISRDSNAGIILEKEVIVQNQRISQLELKPLKEDKVESKNKSKEIVVTEKWKTWAALGSGIITIIMTIITIIAKANGWF
jgi:sugar-specific transcriptional regulator TrmB